ncbi:hypothetical protein FisN_22Lh073 [Fistulifera solaris]|uniref:Uncharacterized protein n=1 Tax=Fistulifera solaris TaxID=1519565 RepID=A0A1Z5JBM2_FISSO|nr:hypothetical protein FisN_22Lh073 [Fistulifera solaris]|eukprot:GAX11400.1 hypothetical protein FisN_22Lh073 [Fistulifera solaris]
MSSPDAKKRDLPTATRPSSSKKPKTPTLQSNVINLQGLVHAMENNNNTEGTEAALAFRVERCQLLWNQVAEELQRVDPEHYQSLQQRVQKVCQGSKPPSIPPTIQRIFLDSSFNHTPAMESEPNDGTDLSQDNDILETIEPLRPKKAVVDVSEMQKQQHEQMQEAISQMASQLKRETARIHSTLQQQTDQLDEMEDLVTENATKVTDLTKNVQEHVEKGWRKTIGTWTLVFTVAGAFLFCMVTISMVPKRQGTCLFFCAKTDDQYCRILPGGRQECIPVAEINVGKQQASECTVDGECMENHKETNQRDARSAVNVFAEEAAIDEIDPNIPFYNGRPFSGKEIRKAAAGGDLRALSAMVEMKPEFIDAQDSNGWSALHLAARSGHEDIVLYLLDHGCNAVVETSNGRTALDIAYGKHGADHPVSKLLEELFESGSTPNGQREAKQPPTGEDIRSASQTGNLSQLMEMLLAAPDLIDAQDNNGWAAIHLSARAGHTPVIQYLIEAGCQTQIKTKSGESALAIAVRALGHDHAIVHMLAARPDAEPMVQGRIFTEHDVRLAAQQGNLELLKEMGAIKRKWLESHDENKWAALHQAARSGHLEIVEYLLEQRCDPNALTKSGSTALDIAKNLHGDDHPVVTLLMESQRFQHTEL